MNIINRRVDRYCFGDNLGNKTARAGTVTFKGVPGVPVAFARSLATMREICSRIKSSNYGSNIAVRQLTSYVLSSYLNIINVRLLNLDDDISVIKYHQYLYLLDINST